MQSVSPDGASEAVTLKPGATTSEFILTMLIVVLGYVTASGLVTDNVTLRIIGIVSATLKAGFYTWSRTMIKTAAMICVVMFAFHSSGCASTARLSELGYASATEQGIGVGFLQFDAEQQDKIVHDPALTSLVEVNAALATYRGKRDKFLKGYYAAIEATKVAYKINDKPTVATAIAAVAEAVADYKALTGGH